MKIRIIFSCIFLLLCFSSTQSRSPTITDTEITDGKEHSFTSSSFFEYNYFYLHRIKRSAKKIKIDKEAGTLKTYLKSIKSEDTIFAEFAEIKKPSFAQPTVAEFEKYFAKLEGYGGEYEFIRSTTSKDGFISADHWPPESVYKHAGDEAIQNMLPGDMATLSLRDLVHQNFLSTGGQIKPNLLLKTGEDLEGVWRDTSKTNLERSHSFNSHMALLFKKNMYADAIRLGVEGYEIGLVESYTKMFQQQGLTLDLGHTTLGEIVDPSVLKVLEKGGLQGTTLLKDLVPNRLDIEGTFIESNIQTKDFLRDDVIWKLSDGSESPVPPGELHNYLKTDKVQLNSKIAQVFDFSGDSDPRLMVPLTVADVIKPEYLTKDGHLNNNKISEMEFKQVCIPEILERYPEIESGILNRDFKNKIPVQSPLDSILQDDFRLQKEATVLNDVLKNTDTFAVQGNSRKLDNIILSLYENQVTEDGAISLLNSQLNLKEILKPQLIEEGLNKHWTMKNQNGKLKDILRDDIDIDEFVKGTGINGDSYLNKVFDLKMPLDLDSDSKVSKYVLAAEAQGTIIEYNQAAEEAFSNLKPGIAQGIRVHMRNFNKHLQDPNDQNMLNKFIDEYKADTNVKDVELDQRMKKGYEKYQIALAACPASSGSRRRKRFASGSCIMSVIKKPKLNVQLNVDNNDDPDDDSNSQMAKIITDVTDLKSSLDSGDFIDNLINLKQTNEVDFELICVGKMTLKHAIEKKFSQVVSTVEDIGADVYSGFKTAQTVVGYMNMAFTVRNLANGVRNGDIKSISTTVGMLGAGKLGSYLKDVGETKGLWKFSQEFVSNAGETIGVGLDVLGIGFDLMAIGNAVDCLNQSNTNQQNCDEEQKIREAETNRTILLMIFEHSNCSYPSEICGGRDAVTDIVSNSISIGLNVVGMACPPCQPVTKVLDFVLKVFTDAFQAGKQIEAFDKIIKLTEDEKTGEWFRLFFQLGFSTYLIQLKELKLLNNHLVNSMSAFLLKYPQFSAIISPRPADYECRLPWYNRPLIDPCPLPSLYDTSIIDLEKQEYDKEPSEEYIIERWAPDVRSPMRLFCEPQGHDRDSSNRPTHVDSYCVNSFGVEYSRNFINGSRTITILHFSMFHLRHWRKDIALGYQNTSNIFIFNNSGVNFEGGNMDDVFLLTGCCPIGIINGGGGMDSLDLSQGKDNHERNNPTEALLINIPEEYIHLKTSRGIIPFMSDRPDKDGGLGGYKFLDEPLWSIYSIEHFIGTEGYVEHMILGCDTRTVNLLGGYGPFHCDEIRVNLTLTCDYQVDIQLSSYSTVNLANIQGQGIFNFKVNKAFGQTVNISSNEQINNFLFLFPYDEIINLEIHPGGGGLLLSTDVGDCNIFNENRNWRKVQLLTMENDVTPSAQIHVEKMQCLFFINVPIEKYNHSIIIGHFKYPTVFNISSLSSRETSLIIKGGESSVFTFKGFSKNVTLDALLSSKSDVDFSSFTTIQEAELKINLKQNTVYLGNESVVNLIGNFTGISGRRGIKDSLICSCSLRKIELHGGGDNIIIPHENCKYNLTLRLNFGTYVKNGGDGRFVYLIPPEDLIILEMDNAAESTSDSKHLFLFEFSMNDIASINLQGDQFQLIHTKGGFKIVNFIPTNPPIIFLNTDPPLQITFNEKSSSFQFLFNLNTPQRVRGHWEVGNVFVFPKIPTSGWDVIGGAGDDVFIMHDITTGLIRAGEGINVLDYARSDFQDDLLIDGDSVSVGNDSLTAFGITHIIGRPGRADIALLCKHHYVNLLGGKDIVVARGGNCSARETTIVARDTKQLIIIDSTSGSFTYNVETNDIEDQEWSFVVYCTNSVCTGTEQTIQLDFDLIEIKSIDVDVVEGQLVMTTSNSETITFGLKPFINGTLDVDFNLEFIVHSSVESQNAKHYFTFKTMDGIILHMNNVNVLTATGTVTDCFPDDFLLIENYSFHAFRLGATFLLTCIPSDPKHLQMEKVYIFGGEKMTDFLENVQNYETILVGNYGVETTFTIINSTHPTYIHISESTFTRNVLNLKYFYDPDTPIESKDFPQIIQHNRDLIFQLKVNGQDIIFVDGTNKFKNLTVVLRYSELEIYHHQDRNVYQLRQKTITIPERKNLVVFSRDEFEKGDQGFDIGHGIIDDDSIFKFDESSLLVTNFFQDDKRNQKGFAMLIAQENTFDGSIQLQFEGSKEIKTINITEFKQLEDINMALMKHYLWRQIGLISFTLCLIAIGLFIVTFSVVWRKRRRKYVPGMETNPADDAQSEVSMEFLDLDLKHYAFLR